MFSILFSVSERRFHMDGKKIDNTGPVVIIREDDGHGYSNVGLGGYAHSTRCKLCETLAKEQSYIMRILAPNSHFPLPEISRASIEAYNLNSTPDRPNLGLWNGNHNP